MEDYHNIKWKPALTSSWWGSRPGRTEAGRGRGEEVRWWKWLTPDLLSETSCRHLHQSETSPTLTGKKTPQQNPLRKKQNTEEIKIRVQKGQHLKKRKVFCCLAYRCAQYSYFCANKMRSPHLCKAGGERSGVNASLTWIIRRTKPAKKQTDKCFVDSYSKQE